MANPRFSPEAQVEAEEMIASIIFDFAYPDGEEAPGEESCAEMGRRILRSVMERFRPDTIAAEVCSYCGSRNTGDLGMGNGEQSNECYDCGKTYAPGYRE
jgi:hypothetical protein